MIKIFGQPPIPDEPLGAADCLAEAPQISTSKSAEADLGAADCQRKAWYRGQSLQIPIGRPSQQRLASKLTHTHCKQWLVYPMIWMTTPRNPIEFRRRRLGCPHTLQTVSLAPRTLDDDHCEPPGYCQTTLPHPCLGADESLALRPTWQTILRTPKRQNKGFIGPYMA